ncbi:hypothetical protein JXR93_13770 [bacterium]|nr:hypothetical protein [bacterium]
MIKKAIISLFIMLLVSCTTEKDEKCSYSNPEGSCEKGEVCYSGVCFLECSDSILCPTSFECFNNRCYNVEVDCSRSNPYGKCSNEGEICEKGVCKNTLPCGEDNLNGICEDSEDICYQGICLEIDGSCRPWNTFGSCPKGYYCSGEGKCEYIKPSKPCSPIFPDGICPDDAYICISGSCILESEACLESSEFTTCPDGMFCNFGTCITKEETPCSTEAPFGYCPDEQTCVYGVCYDFNKSCSIENPYGKCAGGNYYCVDGSCIDIYLECDIENPDFQCPDTERQECILGKCVDREIFCSQENLHGVCMSGFSCVDGECIEVTDYCSPSNINGTCPYSHLVCINGECLDSSQKLLCSSENPQGLCSEGQNCINESCVGSIIANSIGYSCVADEGCLTPYICDKTFLDGYCSKECLNSSDCGETGYCFKKSPTDEFGVCLAECSPSLPNSCNRENYVCMPTTNDNGACIYNCSFNNCFETGKTCNIETGICE